VYFLIVTLVKDNYAEFWKTRTSILNQTHKATHLIIDSSENSVNLPLVNPEPNLIYLVTQPSSIYEAMNDALDFIKDRIIQDPYVLFLNSGDELSSRTVLERLTQFIARGEGWFYTSYMVKDPLTNVAALIRPFSSTLRNQLYIKRPIHHQALFVRASILALNGHFNTGFKVGADWDYICRLRLRNEGQFIDIVSTNFELGGYSSINRKQGNKELFFLRRKYLKQTIFERTISLVFFLYREFRLKVYFSLLNENPRMLKLARLITGWREADNNN